MIIYKIVNALNGKIYVGQTSKTIEHRFRGHKKSAELKVNRKLYDAMNKYGIENFQIYEIEKVLNKTQADEREKFWIEKYNTFGPNGYNMTIGGGGGYTLDSWSEEQRNELYERQANKRKGQKRSPETRKKLSELKKGKTFEEQFGERSDEIKKKISETNKKKGLKPPKTIKYGKENSNYVDVDVERVKDMIKHQWKLVDIAKEFNTSTVTIHTKLKQETGKTFIQWRNEYGISGAFGKVQRIDSDR